jgi:hypothetical protein
VPPNCHVVDGVEQSVGYRTVFCHERYGLDIMTTCILEGVKFKAKKIRECMLFETKDITDHLPLSRDFPA